MNVFGKSFEFNGILSDRYDVVLCSFNTVDNNRSNGISYKISKGNITENRPSPNFYGKSYGNVLEFQIEICKNCGTNDFFTTEEQKDIIRWITSPYDYRKFKIIDNNEDYYHSGIEYFCICTDYNETVINDHIGGMLFKFECNAPYGFYEEQITEFAATTSTPSSVIVNNLSDELEEDYYPIIELESQETGDVTIVNSIYPDEIMELKVLNGQTLVIDNMESDISDNINMFNYNTDTNLCWLRLAPGENIITITGNVTGYIKCLYPRKAGI